MTTTESNSEVFCRSHIAKIFFHLFFIANWSFILQLVYSFVRGSYGVQHQYQIFWQNTALPDDDTALSERGVTGNCVVNVDIHDMVCVFENYKITVHTDTCNIF